MTTKHEDEEDESSERFVGEGDDMSIERGTYAPPAPVKSEP